MNNFSVAPGFGSRGFRIEKGWFSTGVLWQVFDPLRFLPQPLRPLGCSAQGLLRLDFLLRLAFF
ncbi:MAG TPA: hypothetical protein DDY43_01975 [Synechococcales bacterium UBA10510]|nr:hypothetical protein [Synechococcales bacterium UBA10510]